jgi:hypothetical protein
MKPKVFMKLTPLNIIQDMERMNTHYLIQKCCQINFALVNLLGYLFKKNCKPCFENKKKNFNFKKQQKTVSNIGIAKKKLTTIKIPNRHQT